MNAHVITPKNAGPNPCFTAGTSSGQIRPGTAHQIPQNEKQPSLRDRRIKEDNVQERPPRAGRYIHTSLHIEGYVITKHNPERTGPQSVFHGKNIRWTDQTLPSTSDPKRSYAKISPGASNQRRPFANPHVPAMGAGEGRAMSAVSLPLLTDKSTPGSRLFTYYAYIETGHDNGKHQTQRTGPKYTFHGQKNLRTDQTPRTIPKPAGNKATSPQGTPHHRRTRADLRVSPMGAKEGKTMNAVPFILLTDKPSDTPTVYLLDSTYKDGLC